MELLTLDSNFQPLSYLQSTNLQWNREYYQTGNFSVQIPADQYQAGMNYIYTPDRPETGIIQKVELTENIKGRFVQMSGFFLESILNDKIVYPTFYGKGAIDSAVASMISKYKADIPLLKVGTVTPIAESTAWQETGGQLGDVAFTKLQTQQMSFHCLYDYQENVITFTIWKGIDRTQSQSQNSFVTFSDGFKNLSNVTAAFDNSNHKNYAVVAGEGEGSARKIAYADQSNGGYRKILFVDAKGERFDSDEQTQSEYLEGLQQKGYETLLDYQKVQNIEVDVTEGTFQYLLDFDLGDLVDVVIESLGVDMQARIVSVHEIFKSNNHTVTIELGDKKVTQIKKARLIY